MTIALAAIALACSPAGADMDPQWSSRTCADPHVLTIVCDRTCRRHHRWRRVVRPYRAILMRIAWCESRGNHRAISRSGRYRGLLQFDFSTWASVGGRGDPAAASRLEQLYRGALLYRRRGPAPWPVCGFR